MRLKSLYFASVAVLALVCSQVMAVSADEPQTLDEALAPCAEHLPQFEGVEYEHVVVEGFWLRSAYRGVPEDQLDSVVEATAALEGFAAYHEESESSVALACFVLTDPQLAVRLPTWMKDGQLAILRLLGIRGIEIEGVEVGEFELVESDASMIIQATGTDTNTGAAYINTLVRVVRGGHMVEIALQQAAMEEQAIAQVIEMAFERLSLIPDDTSE